MTSEQTPTGTSGNAPLYLIVSASTPVSMSGDQCGKVLVTPQQPQQNLQASSIITSTAFNGDVSPLCSSFAVPAIHPQVALVNAVNHVAMSAKEMPGQISNQGHIRVFPSLVQTIQNENPQTPDRIQPHQLTQLQEHPSQTQQSQVQPPQQMNSKTPQPPQPTQQFQTLNSSSVTGPMALSGDEVGTQLLALLGALQQRQQKQVQMQPPPAPPPPPPPQPQLPQQQPQQQLDHQHSLPQLQPTQEHQRHHLQPQHQSQHVILPSPSEIQVVDSPTSTSSFNQIVLPQQIKQMQQSIQSGQDIGQVLQAVLSQTAAMQGNLTTILTAITTLMQQQQQQQLQQMKQEHPAASVASPSQPPSAQNVSAQQCLDTFPALNNACKSFTSAAVQSQTPTSLDSSLISNSFLCAGSEVVSQPIVSINDSLNFPSVHSGGSIYDSTASFSQSLHSVSTNSSQTSTVASNFGIERSSVDATSPKSSSLQSSLPPISVPMDVDALLQQIFGDTSSQKFDPVLGSTKLDVQDSLVNQIPVMSASVSNSHFVDSLLSQPHVQTEQKCMPGVERQLSNNNGNNNSSGSSSTLRSLLTESSWLNQSSKPSDSIILNSDNVASDSSSLYANSNPPVVNCLSHLPSSVNEHITNKPPMTATFDSNVDDQTSHSSSTQQDQESPQSRHILEVSGIHQPMEEVSNHPSQQQIHELDRLQMKEPDEVYSSQGLKVRKVEDEHTFEFESNFEKTAGYAKAALRKARDGDSSGDESSPSCSPSSSRCGSPYLSRNSPDFMASEVICQDSDTQMSVIRRYHDLHIGSCSDSAMDEFPVIHSSAGDHGLSLLPPGTTSVPRSSSMASAKGGLACPASDEPGDAEEDKDEMQPAAKQRRGINQTHVSDLHTTDEESNHGTYVAVTPWSSSHVSSPSAVPADLSSDAGNTASPPLIVNQTPRLSGSGASLIMPVSNPTPETVFPPAPSHRKIPRLPSLGIPFSARNGPCELKILVQPEEQHRARYMTEGSRGAVKDRSGQIHPVVQLLGWTQTATLQVFVGTDTGRVKPHGFYQACKVSGKNSTPCKEKNFDGTNVIEIQFDPKKDMKLSIDCVGILKLRNADVEQRVGLHKTKKSTKARMVFRVNLPRGDASFLTLQTFTDAILCTQPIGSPEISRISLIQATCRGGVDLFIIGKNFAKGTKVVFQEMADENRETVVWENDALVETEFLGQSHLICTIPPYRNQNITSPVPVHILVKCNGRISEPHMFTYIPEMVGSDQIVWNNILSVASSLPNSSVTSSSLANSACSSASVSTFVSPVAVELNKLVQMKTTSSMEFLGSQALGAPLNSSGPFQLPLSSPKASCASPSAGSTVPGGPASIVSSSTGPDSVASNACVVPSDGSVCDLALLTGVKSSDGDTLTSRESLGQNASVPDSNTSGNSPAAEVGVEQMDWSKLELPADLAGHSDDFNFLTELSASTANRNVEEATGSVTRKTEEPNELESQQDGSFFMQ